jgi:RNA polymerase sigma-70 factor (ECF subfamily)
MTQTERERLFLEVFENNKSSIERLCYGYLASPSDIDDLFQEIMTNVWNNLPSFRHEAKISTWVYRIAVNTALVYRRKLRCGEALTDIPDPAISAHRNLEQEEQLAALRKAIAALPDQDRLIITLLLEALSYKEISEITGLSVNHVGVKISRIKQTLEQLMSEVTNGAL